MEGKEITANGKSRRVNDKKTSASPSPSMAALPPPPPPPPTAAVVPPLQPPSPSDPPQAQQQQVPPFLSKCYDMVDNPSTDATVSWNAAGNSFVVWDQHAFARDLLPKYFKHNNLSSFVRQLNTYGFRKVDPDRCEFANEGFLRGQKHLLRTILRRKHSQNPVQPNMPQPKKDPSIKACVEVGKFGFEEEIEMLKRDKSVLMQELVKLRQHQQNTDNELRNVRDRIQVMEQQQQQMMSFLAMAVQNPGFMAQLVQQNGSNWWRVETNKKRRLPVLEEGMDGVETSSEGQIVKYQPIVTENSNPLLTPVPNVDVRADLGLLSDGVDDLHINMGDLAPSFSIGDEFLSADEYLDLEKLLASPAPENNSEAESHNPEISAVGMDFDSTDQGMYVESSQDLVHPNEHMVVEHPFSQMNNKY